MKSLYSIIRDESEARPEQGNGEDFAFQQLTPEDTSGGSYEFGEGFVTLLAGYNASSAREAAEDPAALALKNMEALRENAIRQAEEIVDEARRKGELIEREAYEQGYKQGVLAGEEIGKKKFASVAKSLEQAVGELQKAKDEIIEKAEPAIVELALATAKKIVQGEIHINPDVIIQTVRACMKHLVNKEKVTIRLNPSDHSHVMANEELVMKFAQDIRSLVFEIDSSISRGGAIVETDFGDLDARIDHQLDQVEKQIVQAIRERGRASDE